MLKESKFILVAENYTDIMTLKDFEVTESSLIVNKSDEALKVILKSGLNTCLNTKDFPCYIQAVERCIKLEAEASSSLWRK